MKKLLFIGIVLTGIETMVIGGASAQVSVHIGGTIGNAYPVHASPYPVYQAHPVYGKRLPPGQAKKIYGVKSARYFAPGHHKRGKHYKGYNYRDDRYAERHVVFPAAAQGSRVVIDAHVNL